MTLSETFDWLSNNWDLGLKTSALPGRIDELDEPGGDEDETKGALGGFSGFISSRKWRVEVSWDDTDVGREGLRNI